MFPGRRFFFFFFNPRTLLFWYISKSVFSSLLVSAVHDFFQGILLKFYNAIFRVRICWFQDLYVYVQCPYTKKNEKSLLFFNALHICTFFWEYLNVSMDEINISLYLITEITRNIIGEIRWEIYLIAGASQGGGSYFVPALNNWISSAVSAHCVVCIYYKTEITRNRIRGERREMFLEAGYRGNHRWEGGG